MIFKHAGTFLKGEMDSLSTGIGNKLKPCTKFFSTSGSSSPAIKTRLCNMYNTAEGCKFGHKCHFAHGECELGKPIAPSYEGPRSKISNSRMEAPPPSHGLAEASFGAFSTAKISVDASLVGAIIGKDDVNTKQIYDVTGAKLSIIDHGSEPNLRNIELKGTFDQIMQASSMVCELISNIDSAAGNPMKNHESEQLNLRNIELEGTFDQIEQASVLGKPTALPHEEPRSKISASRMEVPPPSHGQAASFGASSNAKISVDASLDGAIIGKKGVYSKPISPVTGAKLSIRDHESEQPNLRNMEVEGTFDQIKQASVLGKRTALRMEAPPPSHGQAASFGASPNAEISVDASLAGAIIGKNGVYSKPICRVTGAKLSIRDHESEQPNLRNIELEGTFDQMKQASVLGKPTALSHEEPRSKISASELISNIDPAAGNPMKNHGMENPTPSSNFKTKLCENFKFTKGSGIYQERCGFAHGAKELRKPGI
ncbi:hypothetical protein UlMin_023930 [Ulmus minor]